MKDSIHNNPIGFFSEVNRKWESLHQSLPDILIHNR